MRGSLGLPLGDDGYQKSACISGTQRGFLDSMSTLYIGAVHGRGLTPRQMSGQIHSSVDF